MLLGHWPVDNPTNDFFSKAILVPECEMWFEIEDPSTIIEFLLVKFTNLMNFNSFKNYNNNNKKNINSILQIYQMGVLWLRTSRPPCWL